MAEQNKLIQQLGIQEGDLIRAGGFAEVFAFKNGQFEHQSDPEALKEAYGQDAFRRVRDIGESQAKDLGLNFETRLPAGSFEELGLDINNLDTEALAQGQQLSSIREKAAQARPGQAPLISSPGDERIFRINPETGEREHIENPDALRALGRTFDEVIQVMPEVLNVFKEGQSINAVMGSVFKEINMQKNIENMMGIDELKKKRDVQTEKVLKALEDMPSLIQGEREKLKDEFDLKQKSELITAMDQQIADFRNDAMVAQELIMSQPVSMAFLTGQTAAMTRIANVQLQTMFAKREAVAGDFDRANQLYTQAFEEFITMESIKIDTMSTALSIMSQQLGEEDAKAARLMDRALQSEQARLERKRLDQQALRDMMLTYPFSGISMGDDLDTATVKANKYLQEIGKSSFSVQAMGNQLLQIETDTQTGEVISTKVVHTAPRGGGGGGGGGGVRIAGSTAAQQLLANQVMSGQRDLADIPAGDFTTVSNIIAGRLSKQSGSIDGIQQKITGATNLGTPIELTDNELEMMIWDDFQQGNDLATVHDAFENSPIANKQRGQQIANTIYSEHEAPGFFEQIGESVNDRAFKFGQWLGDVFR